jgi:hypothetical protein
MRSDSTVSAAAVPPVSRAAQRQRDRAGLLSTAADIPTVRASTAQPRDELLDTEAVALRLLCSVSYLRKARIDGGGPPYVTIGALVRYEWGDVVKWCRARKRSSTSGSRRGVGGRPRKSPVLGALSGPAARSDSNDAP